jgi:hypothetical protein
MTPAQVAELYGVAVGEIDRIIRRYHTSAGLRLKLLALGSEMADQTVGGRQMKPFRFGVSIWHVQSRADLVEKARGGLKWGQGLIRSHAAATGSLP